MDREKCLMLLAVRVVSRPDFSLLAPLRLLAPRSSFLVPKAVWQFLSESGPFHCNISSICANPPKI